MKAILLFKKEVIAYSLTAYISWVVALTCGSVAYINPPAFILQMDTYTFISMFTQFAQATWGMIIAFAMAFMGVVANKAATKWWDEKGKYWYEKMFPKNKKRNS